MFIKLLTKFLKYCIILVMKVKLLRFKTEFCKIFVKGRTFFMCCKNFYRQKNVELEVSKILKSTSLLFCVRFLSYFLTTLLAKVKILSSVSFSRTSINSTYFRTAGNYRRWTLDSRVSCLIDTCKMHDFTLILRYQWKKHRISQKFLDIGAWCHQDSFVEFNIVDWMHTVLFLMLSILCRSVLYVLLVFSWNGCCWFLTRKPLNWYCNKLVEV